MAGTGEHGPYHQQIKWLVRFDRESGIRGSLAYRTKTGYGLLFGYEMTDWFDLSNRSVFIDIHEGLYGPFETDILLEGLFARVAFRR